MNPSGQNYKDIPNQNFVEVRLNSKNIREISKDEALQRYKRNAYIMGRIFSYNQDSTQDDLDDVPQVDKRPTISPEMVKTTENELIQLKKKHTDKIEEYKERNRRLQTLMNDMKQVKNEKDFSDIMERLKQDNFYAYEHPFLNRTSPFYMNADESIVKKVDNSDPNSIPPTWELNENIHLYQL